MRLSELKQKKIIVAITGGIAAYKIPLLVRELKKQGAEVRVIMTSAAKEFVAPLTLQTLSNQMVAYSLFEPHAEFEINHIELAKWPDLILIAPASANIIAKLTVGMADDLLSTVCLATTAPIALAPAMNQQMYHATVTQQNLAHLQQRGMHIWGPAQGEQACGDCGYGRMLEPVELLEHIQNFLYLPKDMQGYKLLITAGPTQEPVDPVRFISNHSSGKMGFALATAAVQRGAHVTLISGPVHLTTPYGVNRLDVNTAQEMEQCVMLQIPQHDIFISCAAVVDYRPTHIASQKIKKQHNEQLQLCLQKNPDILLQVGTLQHNRPFVVGFAAETENMEQYARKKLIEKQLNMICANDVSQEGQGFHTDTNQLHLYWPTGSKILPLTDKATLAHLLLDEVLLHYEKSN